MRKYLKFFLYLYFFLFSLSIWLVFNLSIAKAQIPSPSIQTKFISDSGVTFEQLSQGDAGKGVILYYLSSKGPDQPSLMVRLSKDNQTSPATAAVFEAPANLDYIPIKVLSNRVEIEKPLSPAITISSLDGWWVRDGKTNYNLDIRIYSPMFAMWGPGADPTGSLPYWKYLTNFDKPTINIQVRDPNYDGVPKWDWRTLLPAFVGNSYYRTNYSERKCASPIQVEKVVAPFWPFVAESGGYEQVTGKFHPPIIVDWEKAKITHFSELVTARNQNCSYTIYSFDRLEPGKVNQADHEAPFAFYDLSGQGRGYPNLILRAERYPTGDKWSSGLGTSGQLSPRDIERLRYSWRATIGDWKWDYKVELLGFHPYTFNTPLAGGIIQVDAPDYESYPNWAINKSWPVATFIDTEGKSYPSSEGIYEWSPTEIGYDYLFGRSETPQLGIFNDLRLGFRGEYRFRKDLPPSLYFSPIDNRLHLLGAETGLVKLEGDVDLKMENLNSGSYINKWTLEGSEQKENESLYALEGYLLYSDTNSVEFLKTSYKESSFEIKPPTDKKSWEEFQNQLKPLQNQKKDFESLKPWIKNFSGENLKILGGTASNVFLSETGFHFTLNLNIGFNIEGTDILGISNFAPGKYFVKYEKNQISIEELTAPKLTATLELQDTKLLEQVLLPLVIKNEGFQDVSQGSLELLSNSPANDVSKLSSTRIIQLGPKEQLVTNINWVPSRPGKWKFTPIIHFPDDSSINLEPIWVNVLPSNEALPLAILDQSTPLLTQPLLFFILIVLATIPTAIFWRLWKTHE